MINGLLILTYIFYGLSILMGISAVIIYRTMDHEGSFQEIREETEKSINDMGFVVDFNIVQKDIEIRSYEDIWYLKGFERSGVIE